MIKKTPTMEYIPWQAWRGRIETRRSIISLGPNPKMEMRIVDLLRKAPSIPLGGSCEEGILGVSSHALGFSDASHPSFPRQMTILHGGETSRCPS